MADATPQLARSKSSARTFTGWTIFFLVLLRVAIGWHFFYEGMWKLMQDDWRATGYLTASAGPLRPLFNETLVPDSDAKIALTKENIYERMDARYEQAVEHYQLNEKEQEVFKAFVERKKHGIQDDKNVETIFEDESFQRELEAHRAKLARGEASDRDRIVDRFRVVFEDLDETVVKHMLPEQTEGREPLPPVKIIPADAPEPDDLAWLTQGYLYGLLDQRYNQLREHYSLDPGKYDDEALVELRVKAEYIHQSSYGWRYRDQKKIGADRDPNYVDRIWEDEDFQDQLEDYKLLLEEIEAQERLEGTTGYANERLVDMWKRKAQAKNALLGRLEIPLNDIDPVKMATFGERIGIEVDDSKRGLGLVVSDDRLTKGPLPGEKSPTWLIDWANMLALTAVGVCLMLGLFTRLAALGGISLLMLYYLVLPPWPGVPQVGASTGHYLFVNPNIIEALALLTIASSRVGRWCGLDAFFGAATAKRAPQPEPSPGRAGGQPARA